MCLDNYIGIRGECENAKLYIDDLPGISITKAANFTSEELLRPLDLVKKCFNQAQKEVFSNMMSLFKNMTYNHIVDSKTYEYAGNYELYGLNADQINLKVYKKSKTFVRLHVSNFELYVDRDVTTEFIISDGYGVIQVLEVDLVLGLNKIAIDKYTESEYLSIKFTPVDFKIGVRESRLAFDKVLTCQPCHFISVCDCNYLEILLDGVATDNDSIGFNLTTRCEANECDIMEYLSPIMDMALLYKTGILYLMEAQLTGRVNTYLRNTEEKINELLTFWQGGMDNQNGTYIHGQYGQKVKEVTDKVYNALKKLNSPIFSWSGSFVSNNLPG